jgi:hypothetical protein
VAIHTTCGHPDEDGGLLTPDGEAAVQTYLNRQLDILAESVDRELTDPTANLGAYVRPGGHLVVGKAATAGQAVEPLKPKCPGGNGDCWMEQRRHGGQTHWVWVCECY